MGAWGPGLYSSDLAADLKSTITAVLRLPLDGPGLVALLVDAFADIAHDPDAPDHTTFWLVLADRLHQKGLADEATLSRALEILDGGVDAAKMAELEMSPSDLRKRAAKLAELATMLRAPAPTTKRSVLKGPLPHAFEMGACFAFPLIDGEPPSHADAYGHGRPRVPGWGAGLVLEAELAFGYLPWVRFVGIAEEFDAVPTLDDVRRGTLSGAYSTTRDNPADLADNGLVPLGQLPVDRATVRDWVTAARPMAGKFGAIDDRRLANALGRQMRRAGWHGARPLADFLTP